MVGKLLKYDMRALARPLKFVILGIILLALILTVFMAIEMRRIYNYNFENDNSLTQRLGISVILLSILGIGAGITVTIVFIHVFFYRSMFSDEGYLTHTLPVKSSTLFFTKLLSAVIWMLICIVTITFSVFMVLIFGTSETGLVNKDMLFAIKDIFLSIRDIGMTNFIILFCLQNLLGLIVSILQVFLAITLGCAIANKHRIWAAVGMYAAISTCRVIINGIFTVGSSFLSVLTPIDALLGYGTVRNDLMNALNITQAVDIIKNVCIIVGCYIWVNHLLKKKLNLQ